MNPRQIENAALHLPEGARAELAQKLLDSLDGDNEPDRMPVEWFLDARRRAGELDSGIVRPIIPSEEVARKARAVDFTFLQGLEGTLSEWASEADEEAWRGL